MQDGCNVDKQGVGVYKGLFCIFRMEREMKKIFTILALLSASPCFAQTETKESFVNQVCTTVVTDTTRPYYLSQGARGIQLDTADLFNIRVDMPEKALADIFVQMLRNLPQSDTAQVWDFSKLANAIPYNNDSVRILYIFNSELVVKQGWSKRRIKKEWKKHELAQKQAGGNLYTFSAPVFDAYYQYAAIRLRSYCGSLCANVCIYFFKRINGRWEKVGATGCWVS